MEEEISRISTDPSYLQILIDFCRIVWDDIKNGGGPFVIFTFVAIGWLVFKNAKALGLWIKDLFTIYLQNKKPRRKEKSVKDLKEHPIFNDLIFWKENSVEQILNQGDIGKLELAKRMLYVQLETAYTWLKDLVYHTDYSKPLHNIQQVVSQGFERLQAKQWTLYKEREVPEALLAKFNVINAMSKDYISAKIKMIFTEDSPLSIYEKFNILLNDMDAYYSTLLFDLPKTIQILNGDLNGIVVKLKEGKTWTIGGGSPTKYLPPSLSFVTFAENRLQEILNRCRSSRVFLCAFHNIPCTGDCKTDILDSQYSAVYEAFSTGVQPMLDKTVYRKSMLLAEYVYLLQEGTTIFGKADDTLKSFREVLHKKGVEAFLMTPVMSNEKLIGFIFVEWLNKDIVAGLDIEALKKYVHLMSTKVAAYIDYDNEDNV